MIIENIIIKNEIDIKIRKWDKIMIFIIIILSIVLSLLMRILDVYVVFIENNIKLTFTESVSVYFMLIKNFFGTFKNDVRDKKWDDLKDLVSAYLFHFRLLLVLLSSLTFEAMRIKGVDLSSQSVKQHVTILKFIKKAFPMFNSRRRDIAMSY